MMKKRGSSDVSAVSVLSGVVGGTVAGSDPNIVCNEKTGMFSWSECTGGLEMEGQERR